MRGTNRFDSSIGCRFMFFMMLVLAFVLNPASAFASLRCEDAFASPYEQTEVEWKGAVVNALRIQNGSWFRASQLPAQLANTLVLGFTSDHAYVSYRGKRVDAVGIPGFSVEGEIRRNDSLSGQFFAFIRLEPEQEAKLAAHFEALEKGLTARSLTCSRLSCGLIRESGSDLIPFGVYITPSALMAKMLNLSITNPDQVKIGVVDGLAPSRLLRHQRMNQTIRTLLLPIMPFALLLP